MVKRLPCYELLINDEDSFVDSIALVEHPAIEKDFISFSKQQIQSFQFDEEKRELFGPALIPEQKIYRIDDAGNEYEVFFSKDTIRKIAQTFFKRGFQSEINIEHTEVDADSFVFQSVLVDKAKGIAPMDLPDGTWVVGVKVLNANTWKDIKEGRRRGFSVEGLFIMEPNSFKKQTTTINNKKEDEDGEAIIQMLQKIQNLIKQNK